MGCIVWGCFLAPLCLPLGCGGHAVLPASPPLGAPGLSNPA